MVLSRSRPFHTQRVRFPNGQGAVAGELVAPWLDEVSAVVTLAMPLDEPDEAGRATRTMARILEERVVKEVIYPRLSPLPWLGLWRGPMGAAQVQ